MSRLTSKLMGQVVIPIIPMEIRSKEDLEKWHEVRREYEAIAIKLAKYEDKEEQGLKGIVLKNIDLTGIDLEEQRRKVVEEENEFMDAFFKYTISKTEDNKNHVVEELWDEFQSKLGLLEKEGIIAKGVQAGYSKHLEKIKHRPRQKSCDKCTNCTITTKQYVGQEKRSVYICTKMNDPIEKQDLKHYAEECGYYREEE